MVLQISKSLFVEGIDNVVRNRSLLRVREGLQTATATKQGGHSVVCSHGMSNLPVRDTLEIYAGNWGNEDH
jgi:hypothetical protein